MKPNTKVFPRSGLLISAGSILLALLLSGTAHTATIAWGPATLISGDTNVVNTGAVVGAFDLGATAVPGTTVNGVTFAPFAITGVSNTVGNFTVSHNGGIFPTNTEFGSAAAPFSSLTGPYQTLLQSGAAIFSSEITLTMVGLTVDQAYVFEWWSNDSGPRLRPYITTASSGNTVALNDNTTGLAGGLGQYAIGNFTADSSTQVITFFGSSEAPLLNAFQLRAVPEPTSMVLAALGLVSLGFVARRRKHRRD